MWTTDNIAKCFNIDEDGFFDLENYGESLKVSSPGFNAIIKPFTNNGRGRCQLKIFGHILEGDIFVNGYDDIFVENLKEEFIPIKDLFDEPIDGDNIAAVVLEKLNIKGIKIIPVSIY